MIVLREQHDITFRQRHAQEVGSGQRGPQLAIDAVGIALDGLQAVVRRVVLADAACEIAQGLLFGAESEIHRELPSTTVVKQ